MDRPNDILKETGCLTEQQLRDYLLERLSREEMREAEVHLASCEFCSEALEGLSEMKKPEELPAILRQIRNRFKNQLRKHRSGNRQKKNYIWLTIIVFVIILILLLAYYAIDLTMKGEQHHTSPQQETRKYEQPLK